MIELPIVPGEAVRARGIVLVLEELVHVITHDEEIVISCELNEPLARRGGHGRAGRVVERGDRVHDPRELERIRRARGRAELPSLAGAQNGALEQVEV